LEVTGFASIPFENINARRSLVDRLRTAPDEMQALVKAGVDRLLGHWHHAGSPAASTVRTNIETAKGKMVAVKKEEAESDA
jgi:hypothetical protein